MVTLTYEQEGKWRWKVNREKKDFTNEQTIGKVKSVPRLLGKNSFVPTYLLTKCRPRARKREFQNWFLSLAFINLFMVFADANKNGKKCKIEKRRGTMKWTQNAKKLPPPTNFAKIKYAENLKIWNRDGGVIRPAWPDWQNWRLWASVTRKKSPNVFKSCPEKW